MKHPTHEMNPDKKLLKGKVPTSRQYRNWNTPVSKIYSRYASIVFSLFDVVLLYSSTKRDITENTELDMISAGIAHRNRGSQAAGRWMTCKRESDVRPLNGPRWNCRWILVPVLVKLNALILTTHSILSQYTFTKTIVKQINVLNFQMHSVFF